MIKHMRRNGTEGTTMIEVVVAFAVLLMIMAMFSRSIAMAADLTKRSEQLLEVCQNLMKRSYLNMPEADSARDVSLVFHNRENSSAFSIDARLQKYENDSICLFQVAPMGDDEK